MSKKQRRVVFYSSPILLLLVLFFVGRAKVNRIEENAQLLARSGQTAQKVLGEARAGIEKFDVARAASVYDDDYASQGEGQWLEELQSERDGVRVYEWKVAGARPFRKADVAEQLSRYFKTMKSIEESKFKLDSIERIVSPQEFVIRSFLWLRGGRDARAAAAPADTTPAAAPATEAFETQVMFRMWLREQGGAWKIYRQELIHGATVSGDRTGFTEVAAAAGVNFSSRFNPLFSTPRWEPKKFEIIRFGPAGVSAADYDNDGWYDIFFADGASPRLYRNNGGGSFADVTESVGLPLDLVGVNVGIFADFDNDGYKDIFMGCFTDRSRLFKNVADPQDPARRKFVDVTATAGLGKKGDGDFVVVAAAADYDNDGDLDIYEGRFLDPRRSLPTTLFYTRNGEGNSLLRNDGNLRFTDVTREAGINETGMTLGVAWADYDADGDQDVYVVNDYGRNALLRNNGDGTFADVSKETGTLDFGYGMSSTFGDIDNDGDLDIYVSNVHSGQRWYGQAATFYSYLLTSLRQATILEDFTAYKEIYTLYGADWTTYGDRMVKGNSLLLNDGAGRFTDVSEAARANPFGWYWGSTMFDYDNDGRQDIYAANGWITAKSAQDL